MDKPGSPFFKISHLKPIEYYLILMIPWIIWSLSDPKHCYIELLVIHHSMCEWKFWRPFWSTYIFANKKVSMPTSFVQKYHRTQRHFEIRYTQIIKWHFEHIKYYVKWVIFNKWSKLDTQLYTTSAYQTKFLSID